MGPTRILARHFLSCAVLILLTAMLHGFAPLFAAPQESHKVPVPAPHSIVLPRKMVSGAPATLAVLDAAGRLTPSVVVELSGGQRVTTDVTGRALFTAPVDEGVLTAQIPGHDVVAFSLIVGSPAPASAENPSPAVPAISSPHFISMQDQFAIAGSGFRGEADADHVFIAEQPCLVIAASPVSLIVLPGPHTPVGAASLRVNVSGHDTGGAPAAPNPVSVVALEVSGPAETIRAGATGMLTIRARGTTERMTVDVRNSSPRIIQLTHGNMQRVMTSGGDSNAAQIEMKSLAPGDYAVTARLLAADSSLPDVDAARRTLVTASELATGTWADLLDHLIKHMERSPEDIGSIREELKGMLDDKPTGEFATLLESAWMEIQND